MKNISSIAILIFIIVLVIVLLAIYYYKWFIFNKRIVNNAPKPEIKHNHYNMFVYATGSTTPPTDYTFVWDKSIWDNYVLQDAKWTDYLKNNNIIPDKYQCPNIDHFRKFFVQLGINLGYKYLAICEVDNPPDTNQMLYAISYGKKLPEQTNTCYKLKYNASDTPQPLYRNPYNGILSGYENSILLSESNNIPLGPYKGVPTLKMDIATMVIYDLNKLMDSGFTEQIDGGYDKIIC